jgi:hypothetical protein
MQADVQEPRLIAYQSADGETLQVDPRLVPALHTLAQLEEGRTLVQALARAAAVVLLTVRPLERAYGYYDSDARMVALDVTLQDADPRVVAALLGHEASHAAGDVRGLYEQERWTLGALGACTASQVRALLTEVRIWHELFGADGKEAADRPYELEMNQRLARWLSSPDRFESVERAEALLYCRSRVNV